MQAALDGAREIGFTVISLTLSLIAVFIPLLFMTGLVGRMFREFALTLTIAVVDLRDRLADAHAHDVLAHAAASGARTRGSRLALFFNARCRRASSTIYRRSLEWVLRHETRDAGGDGAHGRRHDLALRRRARRASCRSRTPASSWRRWRPAPDISFNEMERLQAAATDAIRKNPDVEGVVSHHRRQRHQPDAERRPPEDHAEAARANAVADVDDIIARLQQATSQPSRRHRLLPVRAGHPDQHHASAARSTSTRWSAATPTRCRRGPPTLVEELRRSPVLREVASEAQDGGLRALVSVDRETAGRLGVSMQSDQRCAERCFRPAADLDHLRPGQPVPRRAGGHGRNTRAIRRRCRASMCRVPTACKSR